MHPALTRSRLRKPMRFLLKDLSSEHPCASFSSPMPSCQGIFSCAFLRPSSWRIFSLCEPFESSQFHLHARVESENHVIQNKTACLCTVLRYDWNSPKMIRLATSILSTLYTPFCSGGPLRLHRETILLWLDRSARIFLKPAGDRTRIPDPWRTLLEQKEIRP